MDKVQFALEDWDSIIDYYRPNGSSKSWYLEEEGKLSIPKMWGEWEIFDNGKLKLSKPYKYLVQGYFDQNQVEFFEKEHKPDKDYIYFINLSTGWFFHTNKDIGFSVISSTYLNDIRNKKAHLVIGFPNEGFSGEPGNIDLEIIDQWIRKEKLPYERVHYISGNLKIKEITKAKGLKVQTYPCSYFQGWLPSPFLYKDPIEFIPKKDNKYLFLCYNRRARPHRITLCGRLIENKLFKKGKVSFGDFKVEKHHEDISSILALKMLTPLELDIPDLERINPVATINKEHYQTTFVSIVTETLTDPAVIFFSEKIWKPILVGHPFFIISSPYFLKHLKGLGFKTFEKWWDESYDKELYLDKRIDKVVYEIEKLNTKSLQELKSIRDQMEPILKHNQDLYKTLFQQNYIASDGTFQQWNPILKIIREISKIPQEPFKHPELKLKKLI